MEAVRLPFESPTDKIMFHIYHNSYPTYHTHIDFWEFMFVSEGSIVHKINGQSRTLSKNTLCVIRPADKHCMIQSPQTSSLHFNLAIRSEYLKSIFAGFGLELYDKLQKDDFIEYNVSPNIAELLVKYSDNILCADSANTKIQAMTLYLMPVLQEICSHYLINKGIKRQYCYCTNELIQLMNDPVSLTLGVSELAKKCGYSYSHVNRVFTRDMGITPTDYLKKKKLNYAQELILHSDMSMSEIAFKIGYSGYSHFSDFFKSMTSFTPVEWVNNLRNL